MHGGPGTKIKNRGRHRAKCGFASRVIRACYYTANRGKRAATEGNCHVRSWAIRRVRESCLMLVVPSVRPRHQRALYSPSFSISKPINFLPYVLL